MAGYRPWGQLHWLLNKMRVSDWSLISCVSTESRCTSAISLLKQFNKISSAHFVQISDNTSRYSDRISTLLGLNTQKISKIYPKATFNKQHLFAEVYDIIQIANNFIDVSDGNIVFDISCFPKRFFFPMIKIFLTSTKVSNLVITNSIPLKYTDENLAEDYQEISALPLFSADVTASHDIVILSVGHLSMGLPETIVSHVSNREMYLFMPFPGSQQSDKLTWDFVYRIHNEIGSDQLHIRRTSARDLPSAFDNITRSTNNSSLSPLLLPFGPKPIALAMCLYAIHKDSQVYYTQPAVYHPDYSIGIEMDGAYPSILGYLVMVNGRKLYNQSV